MNTHARIRPAAAPFRLEAWRPEHSAGWYCRDDATVDFYLRISSLVRENDCILDLGAGRGEAADNLTDEMIHGKLRGLIGHRGKRIGIDVDPVVLSNPMLDEAYVVRPGERYPFEDETFDVVISDWVVEHIEDVKGYVAEVGRVLKPGGWFCARTTNKWGYIGLGARLASDKYSEKLLRFAQPGRQEHDVFPKYYRMNTLAAIGEAFPEASWLNCSYPFNATPSYHGNSNIVFWCLESFQKLAPRSMSSVIMIFVQRIK